MGRNAVRNGQMDGYDHGDLVKPSHVLAPPTTDPTNHEATQREAGRKYLGGFHRWSGDDDAGGEGRKEGNQSARPHKKREGRVICGEMKFHCV